VPPFPSTTLAGPLAVLALTLLLVYWRPGGLSEAAAALIGAGAALGGGWARVADVGAGLRDTASVMAFLMAMTLLAGLADTAGVFRWAAGWTLLTARGRGWLLFVNVYLLGALVTLLLSLDVTAVVLTPLVCAIVVRLRVDARPFILACAFVANTASLALPVSNLTNIMVYELLGVRFWDFLRYLALPNIAALAVNLGLFLCLFWGRLPGRLDVTALGRHGLPAAGFFRWSLGTLVATVVLLFVAGTRGWSFWPVAVPPALGLAGVALARRWAHPRDVLHSGAGGLPPFVVGMYVVVAAVYRAAQPAVERLPATLGALPGPWPLVASVGATAIGANVVNNLPLALATITFLRTVPADALAGGGSLRPMLAYGALLGLNVGPNLTVQGSLATMLCLSIARRQGIAVSPLSFLRVGILVAPAMLGAATLVLWLLLRGG
jgi:arsenical pump membrane protein